jgi:sigma-B regulation protein RsbU (phosphoserine phosphatase)
VTGDTTVKILIAEDDPVSATLLKTLLTQWTYEVVVTENGDDALGVLMTEDGPSLAILDWMMPGLNGDEVCRAVRGAPLSRPVYLILLTRLGKRENIVEGLESGADDYLAKPFDAAELRARVQAGFRVVNLERELHHRVRELEEALSNVKQLQGLLPICSYCKKIRDDQDYWHQVESYVGQHSAVEFSHSICPSCFDTVMKPQIDDQADKK